MFLDKTIKNVQPETVLAENHLGTPQNSQTAIQIQNAHTDKQPQQHKNPDPELNPDTQQQ